jgi:hypothetical protein
MPPTVTSDQELVNDRIAATALAMRGMSTREAETHVRALDNGKLACAYSVNKVLDAALGRTFGENPNSVTSVVTGLERSGAERVAASDVRPGDLAVRVAGAGERHGHIGFVVATDGGPKILSNSSSRGAFDELQNAAAFGKNYTGHGEDAVEYFRIDAQSVDVRRLREAPSPRPPAHAPENALPGIAFGADITAAAHRHGLDPVLLGAVAAQETGGPGALEGRNVVGDHGHGHGVFQIDDRWHPFATTPAAMDPAQNADYAAATLRRLLDRHDGNVREALHDYNAGSERFASTTTTWSDGKTLSYEDSVLRHETDLRAYLARGGRATPAAPRAVALATDYTQPHADRIFGETRDGRLVETRAELDRKNELLERAERDARAGRVDDVRFVGDGRESAREVARQNEKLWIGIEKNLPANREPPLPDARRDGYVQSGTIVGIADGIVHQDIGRGRTAAYAERDFATPPVAGESYTVRYDDGRATATADVAQRRSVER